jgi:hypothetical protein
MAGIEAAGDVAAAKSRFPNLLKFQKNAARLKSRWKALACLEGRCSILAELRALTLS